MIQIHKYTLKAGKRVVLFCIIVKAIDKHTNEDLGSRFIVNDGLNTNVGGWEKYKVT